MIVNYYLKKVCKRAISFYFKQLLSNKKFSIISNDCWGGEIYKILNRRFNTPFIGLMIMGPCYIKMLEDLQSYLNQPIKFIEKSRYTLVEELRVKYNCPIAHLGDSNIEICFLHYPSKEIAYEKWVRRIQRIDWENLYIKYDCGKDFSNEVLVDKFLKLPYTNKLVFGKENFGSKQVFVTDRYSADSLQQFRNCFLYLNPIRWLKNHNPIFKNNFDQFICRMASRYI